MHSTYCVDFNGDTSAVIPNTNLTRLSVYRNLDLVHVLIILLVVCSIHKNLVEYLEKAGHEADFSKLHCVCSRVVDPHLFVCSLDGANVRVWSEEDMFHVRDLLVLITRVV